jgi:phosphatidylserine/phosphatidylglycerophosphate/cardiolipin synthase-like enzyme
MSRRAPAVVAAVFALAGLFDASPGYADVVPAEGTLQAAFAPWDDIEAAIVDVVAAARKQVLVQAYLFNDKPIVAALIAARRRGIDVRVLIDAEQLATSSAVAARLTDAGIPVWLETKYRNAHNKIIVVDAGDAHATVVTGSFNFTWSAQHKNAENILVARDNAPLAERYALNWHRHGRDAIPYTKP